MTIERRGNFIEVGNRFIQVKSIDIIVNEGHLVKIQLTSGYMIHVSPDTTGELNAETNKIYDKITKLLYDQT